MTMEMIEEFIFIILSCGISMLIIKIICEYYQYKSYIKTLIKREQNIQFNKLDKRIVNLILNYHSISFGITKELLRIVTGYKNENDKNIVEQFYLYNKKEQEFINLVYHEDTYAKTPEQNKVFTKEIAMPNIIEYLKLYLLYFKLKSIKKNEFNYKIKNFKSIDEIQYHDEIELSNNNK